VELKIHKNRKPQGFALNRPPERALDAGIGSSLSVKELFFKNSAGL
jgi:hypothetical protein